MNRIIDDEIYKCPNHTFLLHHYKATICYMSGFYSFYSQFISLSEPPTPVWSTFEYHEGGGQKLWDPIPQNLSGWSYLATSLGAFCGEMLLRPDLGYGPLLSASHPPAIRQPPENVSKTNQIEQNSISQCTRMYPNVFLIRNPNILSFLAA